MWHHINITLGLRLLSYHSFLFFCWAYLETSSNLWQTFWIVNIPALFSFLCCLARVLSSLRRRPSPAWSACPCSASPPRCSSSDAPSTCRPCSRPERASACDAFCQRKQIRWNKKQYPILKQNWTPVENTVFWPTYPPQVPFWVHNAVLKVLYHCFILHRDTMQ